MIRSSKHTIKYSNFGKIQTYKLFLEYAKIATEFYIDYLWTTRIIIGEQILDVSQGMYNYPKYFPTSGIKYTSKLSARVLKSVAKYALEVVSSVLSKRKKDESLLAWKKSKNQKDERLEKKLQRPPTKPKLVNFNIRIDSTTSSLKTSNTVEFDLWLELSSIFLRMPGERCSPKIKIPLKEHKQSQKWSNMKDSKILSGILLSEDSITICYEIPNPEPKHIGNTIGVDQGLTDLLTTSRKDKFSNHPHGWSLSKILDIMCSKKNGSKGFKKTVDLRKNYVNWFVKQLDLTDICELKFEHVENIRFGRNTSRKMNHWSNPLIRDSVKKKCEEEGVLFTHVSNEFNSQRCNKCGWTQKSNRNGKIFVCKNCSHSEDADENASENINNREFFVALPSGFRSLKLNIKGFFWNNLGLYDKDGAEIVVPLSPENL